MGSVGSKRRKRCHSVYATGAIPIGVPGCPELAFWTASMHRPRIVLMDSVSRSVVVKLASVRDRFRARARFPVLSLAQCPVLRVSSLAYRGFGPGIGSGAVGRGPRRRPGSGGRLTRVVLLIHAGFVFGAEDFGATGRRNHLVFVVAAYLGWYRHPLVRDVVPELQARIDWFSDLVQVVAGHLVHEVPGDRAPRRQLDRHDDRVQAQRRGQRPVRRRADGLADAPPGAGDELDVEQHGETGALLAPAVPEPRVERSQVRGDREAAAALALRVYGPGAVYLHVDIGEVWLGPRREWPAPYRAEEARESGQEGNERTQHPPVREERVICALQEISNGNGRQKGEQREEQGAEPEPELTVISHGRESTLIGQRPLRVGTPGSARAELEGLSWTGRISPTCPSPRRSRRTSAGWRQAPSTTACTSTSSASTSRARRAAGSSNARSPGCRSRAGGCSGPGSPMC